MWDDLSQTLNSLRRAPGFALLTLLTLSCGLGFAIYSAAIYFSFTAGNIPFPAPERLVAVEATSHDERTQGKSVHYLDFLEYARATPSLEGLQVLDTATVTLGGTQQYPQNFQAAYVPAAIWPWLGDAAKPEAGRLLQASDELPGAPPVVVIGADIWQNFLAGSKQVIGSHISINGISTEIVGVVPAALRFPLTQQLWLPFNMPGAGMVRAQAMEMGTAKHVMVLGRLKAGASRSQAQQELDLTAQRLATSFPKSNAKVGAVALPYAKWSMPDTDAIYLGLAGAAVLLLSLVCINTANLLLARANERRQELAVRAALGAPRGRLIQQMLAESLILSLAAALIGLFFSAWALEATQQAVFETSDGRMPFWIRIQMSGAAAAFGLGLTFVTALATGLLPAWRASAVDTAAVLRDGRGAGGLAAGRFSRVLVFLQIMLSSLLLLVSAAQTYSVHQRLNAGTGARTEGVLTAMLRPRQAAYSKDEQARAQLWARVEASLRDSTAGDSGVALALSTSLPGGGMTSTEEVLPEGMAIQDDRYPEAGTYSVNAGFFKALEVPLLAGREFGSHDRADSLHVAVINRNFAEQYWPGLDPQAVLGKRFALSPKKGQTQRDWYTVVGVSGQLVQGTGNDKGMRSHNIYLPINQSVPDQLGIAMVGWADTAANRELLAKAIARADPALALEHVYSAEERQKIAYGGSEVMAALCLILGLMTLALGVSGIYGVTSRAVAQRTQEIGVRRAVGASDAQVLRLLLRQGLWALALGMPLGLLLGWLAVTQMDEVGPTLLLGMLGVGLVISAVVMLATWLPARRAIAMPPNMALHCE
ncbi:ABC transporter permease [Roseateles oligotrophus]|uniref:ABC transporter permease n=1 Tax=Roseateles oligotrophus TaxID=1769250 RepID=A0ABT2YLN0_9BURK|nr:FtsX-like permease family protein [Roseateles oligotrophus]MCV2370956.1 ABC transporter permease [Roseateles oligotrophus]